VSSDQAATPAPADGIEVVAAPVARSNKRRNIIAFLAAIVVLDVLAFIFVPPFPIGEPGKPVSGIGDLIKANLELPAPHVIFDLAPNDPVPAGSILSFHPSITNTIVSTWLVMLVVLLIAFLGTRRLRMTPGGYQNLLEFTWEKLEDWAVSLGGSEAARHVPLFVAFFLFILFANWSGLVPVFGKIEALRAPTSDLNVTVGLAVVAFFYFHFRGFQALGVRGYLGKFFVLTGFKSGIANGVIDLFVGLIEFMLEFIKPVTLSMRLFGNIYGGEVALGVITALTIAIVPFLMISLEVMLNGVQALIFSTLALMYTLIAVEGHHADEHPSASDEEALDRAHPGGAPVAVH
jgi:F-type H+-transporting ATPase subunit a